jgi:hypothetical protein
VPDRNPGLRRATALLAFALLASGGACSSAEPQATGSEPTAPAVPASGLVLPTEAEARLAEGDVSAELVRRFLVPDAVSRDYAVGLARDKGGLGSARDVRVCASGLRVGQNDTLLASEHIVGSGPECESWSRVLAWARGAAGPQGELVDLQRASAKRFFTVAVAPYSFRHPLYEAQAGLPFWVLRAARTDAQAVPQRCEPRFVRERSDQSRTELTSYACADGEVAFEHGAAAELAGAKLTARIDALAAFRGWQQALARQYEDAIPERIERLERLWTRYAERSTP